MKLKLSTPEMRKMLDLWRKLGWDIPDTTSASAREIQAIFGDWDGIIAAEKRARF